VAYVDSSSDPERVLGLEMKGLVLPRQFNDYLAEWDDVHYVGRFTCGASKIGKYPECVAYAEDTVIVLEPALGRFTEQEVVAAMDELVEHLLATR
ncbi:hypothetical protein, partial [Tessaracoccus sp. OH4464_COT-324]|uniref:hypothetical protein n=1 Tax=Tessaracoccus sp. OH4464_COT-324 TaxID=2491059 RepID=UPI001F320DF8